MESEGTIYNKKFVKGDRIHPSFGVRSVKKRSGTRAESTLEKLVLDFDRDLHRLFRP